MLNQITTFKTTLFPLDRHMHFIHSKNWTQILHTSFRQDIDYEYFNTHKTEIKNNRLWIRWGGERITPGTHTFVIEYCVVGGLRQKKKSTQVYWNAIAPNRSAPVQSGLVTVNLPDDLNGKVSSHKTYGIPTITEVTDKKSYIFLSNKPLSAGQKLEVKITFPLNILYIFPAQWQARKFKRVEKIQRYVAKVWIFCLFLIYGIITCLPFFFMAKSITEAIARGKARICPQCQRITLFTRSRTLVPATTQTTGTQRVTKDCKHCKYHSELEQPIPKRLARSRIGG